MKKSKKLILMMIEIGGTVQKDRNPVRAGLVKDPPTYPWSSCAIYATGTPSELITLHPSYLALSRYAKVRQRHYRNMLSPGPDPRLHCRDARWTTQRAVGGRGFKPLSSLAGKTKNDPSASTNSGTWSIKGVRYLFYDEASREIDRQKDVLLDEISRRLDQKTEEEKLFTLRWRLL